MPAEGQPSGGLDASSQVRIVTGATPCVAELCRAVIDGRRAAKVLSHWLKRFDLNEPEFQLLRQLQRAPGVAIDQRTLAIQTALSPALVSATVERLRRHGWTSHHCDDRDRRRHLWHLTDAGRMLLARSLSDPPQIADSAADTSPPTSDVTSMRKEAA